MVKTSWGRQFSADAGGDVVEPASSPVGPLFHGILWDHDAIFFPESYGLRFDLMHLIQSSKPRYFDPLLTDSQVLVFTNFVKHRNSFDLLQKSHI